MYDQGLSTVHVCAHATPITIDYCLLHYLPACLTKGLLWLIVTFQVQFAQSACKSRSVYDLQAAASTPLCCRRNLRNGGKHCWHPNWPRSRCIHAQMWQLSESSLDGAQVDSSQSLAASEEACRSA